MLQKGDKKSLSIVLPAYNEQENIEEAVECAFNFLKKRNLSGEVVVVDDGSTDKTVNVLSGLKKSHKNLIVICHEKNMGYGAAVYDGLRAAKNELIFFTDSDRQFDMDELDEFLKKIDEYDVVIGYRKNRSEGWLRKMNARGWALVCYVALGVKHRDIDCAFKLIKKSALQEIEVSSKGAAFSAELLYSFKKTGALIAELPVKHFKRTCGSPTGSKLSVITRGFKELYGFYLTQTRLVKSRSTIVFAVSSVILLLSRLLLMSRSADFFDSNQYLWRTVSETVLRAISQGHPPFHPLYIFFCNIIYQLGFKDNILVATIPSVILGTVSVIFVFLLIKKLFGHKIAWYATVMYALLPFVFISQTTILVDATMHAFFFIGVYLFALCLDKNDWRGLVLALAAGLSLGLSAFAHTQVGLWLFVLIPVFLVGWKGGIEKKRLRLILKILLFILGGLLFVFLYVKLLVYAATYRDDLPFKTAREALKYLALGNVSDKKALSLPEVFSKMSFLTSWLFLITAFLGMVKMLKEKIFSKFLFVLLWFVPSVIVAPYVYENLHGRALMIGTFSVVVSTAILIAGIRSQRWRVALALVVFVQLLFITVPAVAKYKTLPAANEAVANAQKKLLPGGLYVGSATAKTWNVYDGEYISFGDVGSGAGLVMEKINQTLKAGKKVFLGRDAISYPNRRYDGVYFDIRSDGKGDIYQFSSMLSDVFDNYAVQPESMVDNNYLDVIYSVSSEASALDLNKIDTLSQQSNFVFGRLKNDSFPVRSASIGIEGTNFCRVSTDNIGRYDFMRCLVNNITDERYFDSWTLSDTNGDFFVKTREQTPRLAIGLSSTSTNSDNVINKFYADQSLTVEEEKCEQNIDLIGLKEKISALSNDNSYYVFARNSFFDLCSFKIFPKTGNRIEGESFSGEYSSVLDDRSASNGKVLVNKKRDGDVFVNGGPYMSLEAGDYTTQFAFKVVSDGGVNLDVASHKGAKIHAGEKLSFPDLQANAYITKQLNFSLSEHGDDFEFRVNATGGAIVELDYIEIEKNR